MCEDAWCPNTFVGTSRPRHVPSRLRISLTAGASTESGPGFWLDRSREGTVASLGVYVEVGIRENGPLGYAGGGLGSGVKARCSAQGGWGW